MANYFTRKSKKGVLKYYSDIVHNGKRVRRFLGISKKAALKALERLEYELLFEEEKEEIPTWEEVLTDFLIQLELSGITRAQVKHNEARLRDFKGYCSRRSIRRLDEVTTKHCQDFMAMRSRVRTNKKYNFGKEEKSAPISVRTLNVEIGYHKRFFRYCVTNEWLSRNPFDPIQRIKDKTKGKQRYCFTDDDIQRIFKAGGKFNDFYYFLLHTGLRSTDAFSLRSDAFDGQYLTLQMKKTGDWLRKIPVPKHVIDRLGDRLDGDGFVFPELHADRQRRNARRIIQAQFTPEHVRQNNINYHTFRHTFAHNMLARGMPKEVLQTFLGHRSVRTTEIYANWVKSDELEKWV